MSDALRELATHIELKRPDCVARGRWRTGN